MTGDRVAEVLARLTAQRDLLQAVQREVDSIVVRVSSHDGSIEAEVDGRGELTGLRLTERAYANGPSGIASGVVATAGAAARLAAARQFELATRLSAAMATPTVAPSSRDADDQSTQPLNGFDDEAVQY